MLEFFQVRYEEVVNKGIMRCLQSQISTSLRRMTPILSPPPGHPGAVAIGGRGRRVWLEAELGRSLGDTVHQDVLVHVIAVLAHDGAELGQLAVQDTRDRVALAGDDLVQPVGEQRDIGRERQGRTRDVRARVHVREVEDVRGRDQDLGQEGVHGDPEDQREATEPDPLTLRPRKRWDRAGEQQGKRAVPRVHVRTLVGCPGGERVGVRRAPGHNTREGGLHVRERGVSVSSAREGPRTRHRARPLSVQPEKDPGLVTLTPGLFPTWGRPESGGAILVRS